MLNELSTPADDLKWSHYYQSIYLLHILNSDVEASRLAQPIDFTICNIKVACL